MISPTARTFLSAFAACGSITEAAMAARINRALHYRWLKAPDYAEEFKRAEEHAAGTFEAAAIEDGRTILEAQVLTAVAARIRDKKKEAGRDSRLRKVRLEVLKRDNFACTICGFDIALQVHHVISRAAGGSDSVNNLITLCPNHHAMAHLGLL